MTQQIVNNGGFANDPSAEPLYTAFAKVNANDAELYTRTSPSSTNQTTGQIASAVLIQQSRKVVNLASVTSEDLTNAAWSVSGSVAKVGVVTGIGPQGQNAEEISFGATPSSAISNVPVGGIVAGTTYTSRFLIRAKSGTTTIRLFIYDGITATFTPNLSISTAWVDLSQTVAAANTFAGGVFSITSNDTQTSTNVYVVNGQLEVGTVPSEYVSVGVLPAPYHGTGIDGEQYFNYANGNTVDPTTHIVTEAQGAALSVTPGMILSAPGNVPTIDVGASGSFNLNCLSEISTLDNTHVSLSFPPAYLVRYSDNTHPTIEFQAWSGTDLLYFAGKISVDNVGNIVFSYSNAANRGSLVFTEIFRATSAGNLEAKTLYPGTDAGVQQTASSLRAGTGAPNNANGNDGDYYFRADSGKYPIPYKKDSGVWSAFYEEGTWTPVDASGAAVPITVINTCWWIRTGSEVKFFGDFSYTANASGANAITGGLPYTSGGLYLGKTHADYTLASPMTGIINGGVSAITWTFDNPATNVLNSQMGRCYITGMYRI